ncbi:hypothetical protein K1T35_35900 [Pseudonocardia sp. DSM 110487]|uniref:hypothetical protein n=1 Tax=Pseudonocardia sp. DSM 110487 TaxID=2865833 RepID=UPI001C69E279|nr:hypothetical protein [Pseudonocardia sp. DSM 110487]QYN33804.1 hypothetical protein K1T35_35900 [Pseudonocardia sp. DSM 110487]
MASSTLVSCSIPAVASRATWAVRTASALAAEEWTAVSLRMYVFPRLGETATTAEILDELQASRRWTVE